MAVHMCARCETPIRPGLAVLRGNGSTVRAWHRACFHARAVVAAAEEAMTRSLS